MSAESELCRTLAFDAKLSGQDKVSLFYEMIANNLETNPELAGRVAELLAGDTMRALLAEDTDTL